MGLTLTEDPALGIDYVMSTHEWLQTCCHADDRLRVVMTADGRAGLFNERTRVLYVPPVDEILIAGHKDHPCAGD